MSAIRNITIGRTERLYKPVGYTMLANLVNIVPFCLSIEAIRIIFRALNGGGQSLDTTRLWCIFGCMTGYIAVMVLAGKGCLSCQFPWCLRNECIGTHLFGRTFTQTFVRFFWVNGIR